MKIGKPTAYNRRFRRSDAGKYIPASPPPPSRRRPARHQHTTPSLRNPTKPAIYEPSNVLPPTPPVAAIALNRLAFGPRDGDIAAFNALGGDDVSRLTAYVDQQLDPSSIDDSALDARIAGAGFTTLDKTRTQLWQEHFLDLEWEVFIRPIVETEAMKWNRAVYSNRQLLEVLVDFWHDHFSVYGWDEGAPAMMVHYDRDCIRANAMGNFRNMLEAVSKSTTMGFYLDNAFSSADGPNENYAREFLELHTLGAENYYGAIPQDQVPGYPNPVGYVEEDVFEVTRALTGWSVDYEYWFGGTTGEFMFRPTWHDDDSKHILGQTLPAGQGEQDGLDVISLAANHPGTATFVCRKLCRRFISDNPPQSLVDSAAAIWSANTSAPDQIAQVVRHIVLSAEFSSTWGEKTKRPFFAVASAMRAGNINFTMRPEDNDSNYFHYMFSHTGHSPFSWHPPNGYPDVKTPWQSSSTFLQRWRMMPWLVDTQDSNSNWILDALAETPADVRSANALADYWIDRIFGYPLSTETRTAIVDFMAQGYNPDYDLPVDTHEYTQDRVRAMVGLLFNTPEFQWR